MLRKFDHLAIEAKKDRKVLEQLLQQNERFIVKCAYSVTHKYLQKSDDEWSIAMFGFTQAVEGYQLDKGSFYSFADLVIRRKLIDFYREQRKYDAEVLVNPIVFDTEQDSDDDNSAVLNAVAKQLVKEEDTSVKLEIEAIHGVLSNYGFSFFDLVDCSPKTAKTKACCAKAVAYMLQNPLLIQDLRERKMLSIKIIEKNAKVPRKLLERYRKYIITTVEILSGEYPLIAEYLQYMRKELKSSK
jgi:RNA polymerase sigma factor